MSPNSRNRSPKRQQRSNRLGLSILTAAALALAASLGPGHSPSAQGSGPCAPPTSNPIACENQLAGNPDTEWDVDGAGDATIQGFTTDISVNKGSAISFKVDTTASQIRLDIYRMGYYGGMGARKVATINAAGQNQPDCLSNAATGLIDCGNWAVTTSWTVPSTMVSGIYFAKAIRLDNLGASHIMFVVRDDTSNSDLLFQTSDTTWQAYNQYGGNSLYVGGPATNPGRAYKVSYNRPFTTRQTAPEDWVFNAEYPMVRWLEANGYNVSYSTGIDTDRRGAELLEHKIFLSVGHDEYWSGTQRTNVEAARAAGVHLAFFSGNEVFWKTRWENSISSPATSYRTLVSYKETHANGKIDPTTNVWTGTWRDPRFSPPADGNRSENALTGTIFYVNSGTAGIVVPAADGKMRFWRGTSVAGLATGTFAELPNGTLGYEWDEDRDNGFRPAGLIRMSDTTVEGVEYLQDYGSNYASGTGNHALTLYKHASGALVFGSGTVQWSWGLDSNHDRGSADPSQPMQQATVNLFADMNVQPVSLQSGLLVAAPSTDTIPPTSVLTSPVNGATVPANTTITVAGTAVDNGGGQVGGVEISTDGGATWRRANGRGNWNYTWQTGAPRNVSIVTRAADDSGNIETPTVSVNVTVGTASVTCPCSLWVPSQSPTVVTDQDPSAVELGTRFRSDQSGYITAIRFFKGSQNIGPHVGNLWTSGGTLLSTVTFQGESGSGWQEATLPAPVAITANTYYIVSYHTDSGFYTGDDAYFAESGLDNGPLHAPQDGVSGANGVFKYGASGFPTESFDSESYWVDVVFVTTIAPDTTAPTVTSRTPASGASDIAIGTTVTATFSENVSAATVTSANFELRTSANVLVPATVTYAAGTRTATLTPNSLLLNSNTYTVRVRGGSTGIKDPAGNALAADVTWTFTTVAPPPPPPNEGPGGPVLIVSQSANPFSRYYAEILRAEGLNSFTASDITQVTATTLNSYEVVILGEMPLTAAQVTMFSTWVNAGGNLIAMRPDKKLASLLGLTDAGTTLAEGYMQVNTTGSPGQGIVGATMQYHGTADRYTANGATTVATLYSNSSTATANPAVTMVSVGGSGGQAAAFAYDLARSVVYTRQGNPAWSGQERDGIAPIRSDDLFFGAAEPDYVDLTKVAIPQADEQQRLLANMIGFMNLDRKPMPKFWYFPRGLKAVIVMTGDDHSNDGTTGRFNIYNAASAPGCSVADWQCIRATSYIFPNTPITNSEVAAFTAQGFEIGVHIKASGPSSDCNNYTASSINSDYTTQLNQFTSLFPGAGTVRTNRTHCIVWSDYTSQAEAALSHGVRLDTNYYWWPAEWVNDVPGVFTGSGMPMRFAKTDGTIIDVYQATTQMTDESSQSYPLHVNTLLDRALGPEGYYGAFVANMHTDTAVHAGSEAIVSSAQQRGVPIISAKQLLTWTDGRNGSSFGNMVWNGSTLSFTVVVGSGATGLQAMLPFNSANGTLTALTRGGTPVTYTLETIKGVNYARFSASAGAHVATYAADTTAPVISAIQAVPGSTTATVTWTTNEPGTSRVDYGFTSTTLTSIATSPAVATAHTVTLTGLNPTTTYFFRVTSADGAGNSASAPASPANFTTTVVPPSGCPCSIWTAAQSPTVPQVAESSQLEIGVKFRANQDGYITGLKFYKGPGNTGTHVGSLWSAAGSLLASATFSGETASGWQLVTLSSPVGITANTTYVASYFAPNGFYAADQQAFSSADYVNGPLRALGGANGPNGVYKYGPSSFPTDSFNGTNYWVDVVFATSLPPDTTAPTVSTVTPAPNATGIAVGATVNATFSEAMNAATVSGTTVELRTGGVLVASTVTYTAATRTVTLTPNVPLTGSTSYTATVIGGSGGVRDAAGNPMAASYAWSFTTSAPPPPPPTVGPGGPVLVITSTTNAFTTYFAEILRAEGLNAFATADISTVTPASLTGYDVAILGEMALTSGQVSTLSSWVSAGGNLIAMRPDKQLAGLLGLTDAGTTLADAYLAVNTAAGPGAGIVSQTMQFHGTADQYVLNGATAVATLYSTASAATTNPAVTTRTVGTNGGSATAFTYDLARSIVYTRQGNPAWSGLERDGITPVRSDDLFFGNGQPNYVDLSKVAIPQADEQQRLLANLIGVATANRKPLPRFWYFPRGLKAVVVMTGDDHAVNGTASRFDTYLANSPANCNVDNWECIRATSYMYPATPMPSASATAYAAQGFELGVHIKVSGTDWDCNNYTAASLNADYLNQLAQFRAAFPGVPTVRTNRTHCIVWSDYTTQADVAFDNGVRLDTNYYYWPATWVNNVPGVFTGSGMPMRFARTNGTMIDVYQATTQMTDESGQTYPLHVDALLDRALGAEGYYGAFVANMHTDTSPHLGSEAIVASAQARGVPVISAQQLLTWLDGRNGSTFTNLSWNGAALSFGINVATGANGLQAMLPATVHGGPLVTLTRNGGAVAFALQTIKGVSYAAFTALPGNYVATYQPDLTPPVISGITALPDFSLATVKWVTNEVSTSVVAYGSSPSTLTATVSSPAPELNHALVLPNLTAGTTYYYQVSSTDAGGNTATSATASFTTAGQGASLTDTSVADFSLGTPDAGITITAVGDGAIGLAPTVYSDFSGTALPADWTSAIWNSGGSAVPSGGSLRIDGARANTNALFTAGRSLEFVATFAPTPNQHVGWGVTLNETPWAIFSTSNGSGLYARTNDGSAANDVLIPGSWLGTPHVYRIDWNASNVVFSIDGVTVLTQPAAIAASMRPIASDLFVGDGQLAVDSLTMTPYATSGNFVSRVLDGATSTLWTSVSWAATVPSGTGLNLSARFGNTPVPDGTWTAFTALTQGATLTQTSRYIQYQAVLSSPGVATPVLQDVTFSTTTGVPTPSISIDDLSVQEGNSGVTATGLTLRLSAARSIPVSVSYSTANGTATAGSDYTAATGTVTFPAGTLTAIAPVNVTGDLMNEGNETFVVNLASPVNATIADAQAVATIVNDDAQPRISVADVSVNEGNSGATTATVTVSLNAASGQPVTASYATSNGTATAGSDYTAATGTVTIPAGATQQTFTVTLTGDTLLEANETLLVTLSNPTNATFQRSQATLTITNDDVTPSMSISDVSVTEPNTGSIAATFTVTLSAASGLTTTASYATANGTATAPTDYTTTSGTVTFAPGVTSQTVSVSVLGDVLDEANETFTMNLTAPTNATLADGQGVGTIVDNDATPSLVINNVTVTETNTAGLTANFTVTLSAASGQAISVNYATANVTATAPADYTATAGTLTIAAGATTGTIAVPIVGDTLDENTETFNVNLTTPVNVTIADTQGVGTITDNDNPPTIAIANVALTEGNSGTTPAGFVVTLSAASGLTVTVNYATQNSSATSPSDYQSTSGTLTFNPGVTSLTINVNVVGDTVSEATETFNVNLTNAQNASVTDSQGVATITDTDVPTISINNVTVTEPTLLPTNATFTVTLSSSSAQTVRVTYATANNTATTSDYSSRSGTLTFNPGTTSQTISVPVNADSLDEAVETFFVNLTSPQNATIADAQGVGTINDNSNDNAPSMSINNISVTEGDSGTRNATFTVSLSTASGQQITVNYATANGSASSSSDYNATSGTLTFAPGQTSLTITVQVRGDNTNENNETFFVNLTGGVNVTISDSQGQCTINDDE